MPAPTPVLSPVPDFHQSGKSSLLFEEESFALRHCIDCTNQLAICVGLLNVTPSSGPFGPPR